MFAFMTFSRKIENILIKYPEYCDVKFIAEYDETKTPIDASRFLLAVASEVMGKMLFGKMIESKRDHIITIHDSTRQVLNDFLLFAQTGNDKLISSDTLYELFQLFQLGDQYMIDFLPDICFNKIRRIFKKSQNIDDFKNIMNFLELYNNKSYINQIYDSICTDNINNELILHVSNPIAFKNILIGELSPTNMKELIQVIIKWYTHNVNNDVELLFPDNINDKTHITRIYKTLIHLLIFDHEGIYNFLEHEIKHANEWQQMLDEDLNSLINLNLKCKRRINALDVEKKWYGAIIIGKSDVDIKISYCGWGIRFNECVPNSKLKNKIAPIFDKVPNWRQHLKPKSYIDVKVYNNMTYRTRWYSIKIHNIIKDKYGIVESVVLYNCNGNGNDNYVILSVYDRCIARYNTHTPNRASVPYSHIAHLPFHDIFKPCEIVN